MSSESYEGLNDIAVIGMAGRFPRARSVDEFWSNVRDGVECVERFSDEEVLAAGVARELVSDPAYVKAAAILDDIAGFDADFFGYNPREAEIIDPQHRIFLEVATDALAAAGYDPQRTEGPISVFAGCSLNTYLLHNLIDNRELVEAVGHYQLLIGGDKDFLATRLSYKLDLRGPSVDVQTACSTSLVAVHLAVQSLLSYQCDMALAGGVSVAVPQKTGYLYQQGMIFSPDGHCRAFDRDGKGIVAGEGAGVVVLKRLADALADGDAVDAVIKGTAINNDGALKVGYTAPRREGQAEVIAMAQAAGDVDPDTVTYVEAHGTGTPLGDPIEVAALTEAFRAETDRTGFCGIGSVKTNIGHLDAAAGVAGLIKTVEALRHRTLPPSLHFREPNPEIDFESSPFYVVTETRDWPAGRGPRRAGVSSFGIGGTNAHAVLEEAPAAEPSSLSRPFELLPLSAHTPDALEEAAGALARRLEGQASGEELGDVAWTLQVGRRRLPHRLAVVAGDRAGAAAALRDRRGRRGAAADPPPPVAFLLSGQGAQHPGMARELYDALPAFAADVDRCAAALEPHLAFDLREALFPAAGADDEAAAARLRDTAVAQPALFTVEWALARLWMAWGVEPRAMVGHSIGELVAACLGGTMAFEEALPLVALRGRLMADLPPGEMMALALPEAEVEGLLGNDLSLAAVNGPELCVVSGPAEAVGRLEARLEGRGVAGQRLHTSHAFHSAMMEPVLERFRRAVAELVLRPPERPWLSNVSGRWIRPEEATDPAYWARHLRLTVRFADAVGDLLEQGPAALLEIGPGQTLAGLARRHPAAGDGHLIASSLPHPRTGGSALEHLLGSAGELWVGGVELDWRAHHGDVRRRRVHLPGYPFQRRRYWVEPQGRGVAGAGAVGGRLPLEDWFWAPSWRRSPALPAASVEALREAGPWLILEDPGGELAGPLAERLEAAGLAPLRVVAGPAPERRDEGRWTVRPGRREDLDALLDELDASDRWPASVLHLAALGSRSRSGEEGSAEERYFHSLLALVQALAERGKERALRLLVVADGLQRVLGEEEEIDPDKALLRGPVMTLPQEQAGWDAALVDVAVPSAGAGRERLVTALLAEALEPSAVPVAYRGGWRWLEDFAPLALPAPEDGGPAPREGGVYLVTGGLGGVGSVLAQALAEAGATGLVLTARGELPPRERWDALVQGEPESGVAQRIARVLALEAAGAEVLTAPADVTDEAAMAEVLRAARRRFGRIDGVVHAAGVAGGGLIQLKTREAADAVLAPKVEGTRVLHRLLAEEPPDFLLLCSSRNALLPDLGQVDYASANAFLDAWAWSRRRHGEEWVLTVNWDTWREVGMAVETEVPEHLRAARQESLRHAIAPEEGRRAFRRLLGAPLPQVIVSTRDFGAVHRLQTGHRAVELIGEEPAPAGAAGHDRPEAVSSEFVAPRSETEKSVAEIWQQLLGLDRVGVKDDFFELGGHSLLATQALSRMKGVLGVEVALRELFEGPTVEAIAARVEEAVEAAGRDAAADRDREVLEL